MPVGAHVRVSGVWKKLNGIHVKVSGSWKEVTTAYVRVGGVWKVFYPQVIMDATRVINSSDSSGVIIAQILYDNDGSIQRSYETDGTPSGLQDYGEWAVGSPDIGIGDDYHIRMTHQTGTNRYVSGDGLGSWVALTSTRTWSFSRAWTAASDASTYLAEISEDGGTTTLDSSTWTINLDDI